MGNCGYRSVSGKVTEHTPATWPSPETAVYCSILRPGVYASHYDGGYLEFDFELPAKTGENIGYFVSFALQTWRVVRGGAGPTKGALWESREDVSPKDNERM